MGPGPGLTTDWLRHQCENIACLEIDPVLADSLSDRMANTNVSVQCGDATAMPFPDHAFSGKSRSRCSTTHPRLHCRIGCSRRLTGCSDQGVSLPERTA